MSRLNDLTSNMRGHVASQTEQRGGGLTPHVSEWGTMPGPPAWGITGHCFHRCVATGFKPWTCLGNEGV
eukprot:25183-Heterocapsa_arctica.AAC.1